MKKTIAVIYVVLIASIGFLVNYSLHERTYVRQLAANQLVTVTAINGMYTEMQDLINFDEKELPSQVQDYASKTNK